VSNRHILVIDDEPSVHRVLKRILERAAVQAFQVDCTTDGHDGLRRISEALAKDTPYSMIFVDMNMAGLSGLDTVEKIWQIDGDAQIVICTGSSDTSWADFQQRLCKPDALLVIKKPFESIEVLQAAHALTTKWMLARRSRAMVDDLEAAVVARTAKLEEVNRKLAEEITWRDRIETELRLAHRLEAVGQLAAGIAHEINTPIQYVGDNLHFIKESTTELVAAIERITTVARSHGGAAAEAEIAEVAEQADLGYLATELPRALESIQGGVRRIASIVSAMKELSHPGSGEPTEADINRTIDNALQVTANAYRYVADVDKQLGALPQVLCHIDELSQVFLNLIVNAAQAMEGRGDDRRGKLGIATVVDGDDVVVSISDTGCGIPHEHRNRVFDAFFTTKEVGRGTGQGLAIAHAIVVERHGGTLWFDTVVGHGTTFHIRLPIVGRRAA
jgi:two-component system, NtrC family, sensor kinase